jgi:hypothetical protein
MRDEDKVDGILGRFIDAFDTFTGEFKILLAERDREIERLTDRIRSLEESGSPRPHQSAGSERQ